MESSVKRLVVIGVGNVGLPVVKHALAQKIKVLAISRNISKIEIKDVNLELASVDLTKEGALLEVLQPDDTVVYCAFDHAAHEVAFKNSFKAFEEKKIKRVVFTGGTSAMKIAGGKRLLETEHVQKKHPFFAKISKFQIEVSEASKLDWTEVDFGMVLNATTSPEVATFFGTEYRLIEFAKPLEDLDYLSIPAVELYVLSDTVAKKILEVASKHEYLRQHVAINNGYYVSKTPTIPATF